MCSVVKGWRFCANIGGPALRGYMSCSTPSRTCTDEKSLQFPAAGSVQGSHLLLTHSSAAAVQPACKVLINKRSPSAHTEKLSACHFPDCNLSSQQISGRERKLLLSLTVTRHQTIRNHSRFRLIWPLGDTIPNCVVMSPVLLGHLCFKSCSGRLLLSGADDLLPILSFVAIRCQCPQLVSECAALEEFIHEGWVASRETKLSFQ